MGERGKKKGTTNPSFAYSPIYTEFLAHRLTFLRNIHIEAI